MTTPNTTHPITGFTLHEINEQNAELTAKNSQLETELNEAKAQLAPRNGHTFESLTKMWEDGHFFYAKIQSQLLTTQAECAAMRAQLIEVAEQGCEGDNDSEIPCCLPDSRVHQDSWCIPCKCSHAANTTAGKELLEKRQTMIEAIAIQKSAITAITVDRDQLRTRQEELMKIAEELHGWLDAGCKATGLTCDKEQSAMAKLTAFKEEMK